MADRIPVGINRAHILAAIVDLNSGIVHRFGASTTYDLLYEGRRYPPKAVIGLAAARVLGQQLGPYDFKGGLESKCFRILEELGFAVVSKEPSETPANGEVRDTEVSELESLGSRRSDLSLNLYQDYTREDVHDLFDPTSHFTSQAGTWGLQGIVEIPRRPGDYVFFVTFGKSQADHEFDEGITPDGVLRWQSQPKQRLVDSTIQKLIAHDEDKNSIYLFLRTSSRIKGIAPPYTYLGRLKYLVHDHDREQPVYFTWKILDWNLPEEVRLQMNLAYEGQQPGSTPDTIGQDSGTKGLIVVPGPTGQSTRPGVSTRNYSRRIVRDYAQQDAQNRKLGLAGEEAVLVSERTALINCGRADLAELIVHVARVEGDGAGYDIKSFTPEGKEKYIEVKTTRGDRNTAFYMSLNEASFAADHADSYYFYRVFDFDESTWSGKVFVHKGDLNMSFNVSPIQFKVLPAFD